MKRSALKRKYISLLGALLLVASAAGCDYSGADDKLADAGPDAGVLDTGGRSDAAGSDATGSDATGSDATGSDATGSDATGSDATGSDATDVVDDADISDTGDARDADTADTTPDPVEDPCENPIAPGPIHDIDISATVFVGPVPVSGAQRPVEVDSYAAYQSQFGVGSTAGPPADADAMAWSVYLYFENGGERAFVAPTASDVPTSVELERLAGIGEPAMIVVPGLSGIQDAGERALAYGRMGTFIQGAQATDLLWISDLPAGLSVEEITTTQSFNAPVTIHSNRVALYHPWLKVSTAGATPLEVAPSGAVAGVIARLGLERGIWTAPAGPTATFQSIDGFAQALDNSEISDLLSLNINALRVLSGAPVIWGARTLERDDNHMKYVSVRRFATLIDASMRAGVRDIFWRVNDASLRQELEERMDDYMSGLFRSGAFEGASAGQSYFVQDFVNSTSMPDIQAGKLTFEYGFAPIRPAEFHLGRFERTVGSCLSDSP